MSNQGVPSVSSAEVAIASGILGAGVGYVLAPRKYNLEQLITQRADMFEKAVSKFEMAKKGDTPKKAYKIIEQARRDYLTALINNTGEAKLVELKSNPALESAYNGIKKFIPKAKSLYAVLIGALAAFTTMAINYVTGSRN